MKGAAKPAPREAFRAELLKRMPGYKWTIARRASSLIWNPATRKHETCTQAESDAQHMVATGIMTAGLNRLSTLRVERWGGEAVRVDAALWQGTPGRVPLVRKAERLDSVASALRRLQDVCESQASWYSGAAGTLRGARLHVDATTDGVWSLMIERLIAHLDKWSCPVVRQAALPEGVVGRCTYRNEPGGPKIELNEPEAKAALLTLAHEAGHFFSDMRGRGHYQDQSIKDREDQAFHEGWRQLSHVGAPVAWREWREHHGIDVAKTVEVEPEPAAEVAP